MMPASNKGIGSNLGFPDVCNTIAGPTTVPIPYPNIAMNAQAAPFSPNVYINMVNGMNMASKITMTSGDEAGAVGGVASGMIKGPGGYTMGNVKVNINMMPAINMLCPTTGNNYNNPLGAVVVPSSANVNFTFSRDDVGTASGESRLSVDALHTLTTELEEARCEVKLLAEGVGYLRPTLFTASTPSQVAAVLSHDRAKNLTMLIIDLCGCRGGDLNAAIRLADRFLDVDTPICQTREADGDITLHRARSERALDVPLVLLIDERTASAAEVFAGALQSHRRALLVGRRTYGKGTSQQTLPTLDDLGAVYATTAIVLLGDGTPIEGRGLRPDIDLDPSVLDACTLRERLDQSELCVERSRP